MGLRETKKLRTREEIAGQAMRLFVTKGFDHVTVAEVAAAAGVSEKTVFNYFPTKEDLFFDEVPARRQALVDAVCNRAAGVSILEALRLLNRAQIERLASPGFVHFARVIEESPELKAKELEIMSGFAHALTDALVTQGVDRRDSHVVASMLVSVHRHLFRTARELALAGKSGPGAVRRLRADSDRAFELLGRGLGDLGMPSRSTSSR
ncbi:MAG TPA: TetR family transcriptional regulator [Gaiellaceae bacterium]|nr:TetR family transcriptional regulator [Gaiellaceae bacterium]